MKTVRTSGALGALMVSLLPLDAAIVIWRFWDDTPGNELTGSVTFDTLVVGVEDVSRPDEPHLGELFFYEGAALEIEFRTVTAEFGVIHENSNESTSGTTSSQSGTRRRGIIQASMKLSFRSRRYWAWWPWGCS